MFIEASDKTMRGEYTNVNLDYVKSYNIENFHKFENKINFIVFKVEGEEYPVRFSFDNYDDALLAIDAIRFLQLFIHRNYMYLIFRLIYAIYLYFYFANAIN